MQGFIHLLLEAYISETIGSQHLRQIRQLAGVQGPPLAAHYYPDEVTTRLLHALADYNTLALEQVLYQFGVYFMNAPLMRQHYRIFLEGHTSARSFLHAVPKIHRHLGQSLKDVKFPGLRSIDRSPEFLELIYASPRRLCPFLQGVLAGVGQYFNEQLEIREMECQQQGASACRILVRFQPAYSANQPPAYPFFMGTGGAGPSPAGSALGSGPQGQGGSMPPSSFAPMETPGWSEAKRKHDEEEDLAILLALSARQVSTSRPLKPDGKHEPSWNLALSLFEIAHWLKTNGASAEYTRLSLLQRSLSRLAVQGFIESQLDPRALRQGGSPGVVAPGGQGILAAQRYRITSTGQAWLNEMRRRRSWAPDD